MLMACSRLAIKATKIGYVCNRPKPMDRFFVNDVNKIDLSGSQILMIEICRCFNVIIILGVL